MPMAAMPCLTEVPAKSSPITETNLTWEAPVLQAASATFLPTPPKLCFTLPGVEVCKIDLSDGPTVAVISSAIPPMTSN